MSKFFLLIFSLFVTEELNASSIEFLQEYPTFEEAKRILSNQLAEESWVDVELPGLLDSALQAAVRSSGTKWRVACNDINNTLQSLRDFGEQRLFLSCYSVSSKQY